MLSIDMFFEISVYIHDIGRLKLQVLNLIAIGLIDLSEFMIFCPFDTIGFYTTS